LTPSIENLSFTEIITDQITLLYSKMRKNHQNVDLLMKIDIKIIKDKEHEFV